MKPLYLLGAGGHAQKVLTEILANPQPDTLFVGFIASDAPSIEAMSPNCVLFYWDTVPFGFSFENTWFHAAIGDPFNRGAMYNRAIENGMEPFEVINSFAIFKPERRGKAPFIGALTLVETGVILGNSVLIDNKALVDHHCIIGDFTNIGPGALVCGGSIIGNYCHIGAGAVIRENIHIGDHVVIGAGAVVINHIPDYAVAVGNPAKVIKHRKAGEPIFKS